jgi:hypothetical protein
MQSNSVQKFSDNGVMSNTYPFRTAAWQGNGRGMAGEYGLRLPIRPDVLPPVPILTRSMRSDFGSVMANAGGLPGEIAAARLLCDGR